MTGVADLRNAGPDRSGEGEPPLDILVVGAGLAGIAAARDIRRRAPDLRLAILEGRDRMGGTWDLFRYPGVRSDSDLQTLAFADRPVFNGAHTAAGAEVLAYIQAAARERGVDSLIRFAHRVVAADFDTAAGLWQVNVEVGARREPARFACRILYACCGYYDYAQGHAPDFPGKADFAGRILHPQFWPQDFDASGKRIVVIGSGATAITIAPALAAQAGEVVMLQRSPGYVMPLPRRDRVGRFLEHALPARLAYALIRTRNILVSFGSYRTARARPTWARRQLLEIVRRQLGLDERQMADFTPRYEVWDQRLCFDPGYAFFNCLRNRTARVVTGEIDTLVPEGVRLRNGELLPADTIVTATGLRLQLFGGARLSVDGKTVVPGDLIAYKGCMFAGVPNCFAAIGYINASWTLKCQLTTIYVLRLVRAMAARKAKWAAPQDPPAPAGPILALHSGYVERSLAHVPKQGATGPWRYHVSYLRDLWSLRFARVADGAMRFAAR